MKKFFQVFIGFAAEDRYDIAEPIVYHLKNYGVPIWYDRYMLLMGDNRQTKNFVEGIENSRYACFVISRHTKDSVCAMEELLAIRERYYQRKMTVFPILYEISPSELPVDLFWITQLIFKEVNKSSGTREICNHIICRISQDILNEDCFKIKCLQDIISANNLSIPLFSRAILSSYLNVDQSNLNARISLLYAAFLTISMSIDFPQNVTLHMVYKVYEHLFSETKLNLPIDYRELWLLENCLCILINYYLLV